MHCARAFELALEAEGCNVFERFSDAEYTQVGLRRGRGI
jgi:hypothetical protein